MILLMFYCVDTLRTIDLCEMIVWFGSDKGHLANRGHHTYTKLYTATFEPTRHQARAVFELGMGTNNTLIPSNMDLNGSQRASLRGWREFSQTQRCTVPILTAASCFNKTESERFIATNLIPWRFATCGPKPVCPSRLISLSRTGCIHLRQTSASLIIPFTRLSG
jgi:hypothetical protein